MVGRDTPRGLRFPSCLTYQVMLLGYLLGIQRILRAWVEPQFPRPNSLNLHKTPLYITTRIVDISLKLSSVVRTVNTGKRGLRPKLAEGEKQLGFDKVRVARNHAASWSLQQQSTILALSISRGNFRANFVSSTPSLSNCSLAHSRSTPFRSPIIPSPTSATVF